MSFLCQDIESRAERRAAELAEEAVRLAEDRATEEVAKCRELVTEAMGDAEKAKEAEVREQYTRTEVRS